MALANGKARCRTICLGGPEGGAVLRIGLGMWWLESWRQKDGKAWSERGTGIAWAADVADKHRWAAVRRGFDVVVRPARRMAYVVVHAELALGAGLVVGFLLPVALVAGLLLNLLPLVLMIHDCPEPGLRSGMALRAVFRADREGGPAVPVFRPRDR
ncbi:hypothetical protein [Streptomyces sclerotialus]|uniref:hypothetical protein n=1 Tax=Streptomyces sclerotialus TaxID=1957 RepID=UPI00068C4B64